MKQYKLLKDLPCLKAGCISTFDSQRYWFTNDNVFSKDYSDWELERAPDFFELIEPKEFTESQVNRAMNVYFDRCHRISPCKDKAILRNEIINDLRK